MTEKAAREAPPPGNPADPDHWGLEKILLDELSLLRPSRTVPPAVAAPPPSPLTRFKAWIRTAASTLEQTLLSFRADRSPSQWDPAQVSPETYQRLSQANLLALCLSGGGIRSASFCLGILQALALRGRLSSVDYLSTVSGGGYIGSWLSAWCARENSHIGTIQAALAARNEAPQVSSLRDFTNYLTPHLGLTSADTWAGVATVLRNLVLNWLLFLPLFFLLVWLPKASLAVYQYGQIWLSAGSGGTAPFDRSAQLLIPTVLLYFASLLFSGRQLAIQDQQGGPWRPPEPYGAGAGTFTLFGLVPAYAAASLASIVLMRGPPVGDLASVIGWFGLAGAGLWGIALLASSWRIDGQLLARIGAGFVFGVVLALVCLALRSVGDDRYVVVLGVAGCFLAHLIGGILFAGLGSRCQDHDAIREWSARAGGCFMLSGIVWTAYATLVLWDPARDWPTSLFLKDNMMDGWLGKAGDGLLTALGGTAGILAALFGKNKGTRAGPDQKPGPLDGINWNRVAAASALLFLAVLVFELSRLFDRAVFPSPQPLALRPLAVALAVLVGWLAAASYFIRVNKFSMHAFYRNRLIRAYLGASNANRRPSAFTGFDEGDNTPMSDLRKPRQAPLHIVNTALNLVHGKRLAWQERKASAFSMSPLAIGNAHLGYRPASQFGGPITLGTAMAISGAAVSPNMGYHSSAALGLLMTLFNVRLGWWLGNPAKAAWKCPSPKQSVWLFLMELFGLTNDERSFVYLSDGGHFENLGVYEMLRRRCSMILAIDAGCDPDFTFADLGNLVRKARIDFGIEITFPAPCPPAAGENPIRLGLVNRPKKPSPSRYCSVGTIFYPEGTTGELVLVKAALHGDEPEDIATYAAANPTFPHETTTDQFFTESQFESYRRLGLHIGCQTFAGITAGP